jgi:hypothetical protein
MTGKPETWKVVVVLGLHALVVWALCDATIAVGRANLPMQTTLVIHAILAPLFAAAASWVYASRFGYTGPLATAVSFLAVIMAMDFFLVVLVIEKSLDMFRSVLGTWLPFASIFVAAFAASAFVRRRTLPEGYAGTQAGPP